MALCDYKLCDVCGGKAFYDANLDYDSLKSSDGCSREAGNPSYSRLGYVGDWAVICTECSTKYKTAIVPASEDNIQNDRKSVIHRIENPETGIATETVTGPIGDSIIEAMRLLNAAEHALMSYQDSNSSPDLAKEVAADIGKFLRGGLEHGSWIATKIDNG